MSTIKALNNYEGPSLIFQFYDFKIDGVGKKHQFATVDGTGDQTIILPMPSNFGYELGADYNMEEASRFEATKPVGDENFFKDVLAKLGSEVSQAALTKAGAGEGWLNAALNKRRSNEGTPFIYSHQQLNDPRQISIGLSLELWPQTSFDAYNITIIEQVFKAATMGYISGDSADAVTIYYPPRVSIIPVYDTNIESKIRSMNSFEYQNLDQLYLSDMSAHYYGEGETTLTYNDGAFIGTKIDLQLKSIYGVIRGYF